MSYGTKRCGNLHTKHRRDKSLGDACAAIEVPHSAFSCCLTLLYNQSWIDRVIRLVLVWHTAHDLGSALGRMLPRVVHAVKQVICQRLQSVRMLWTSVWYLRS
eukprot:5203938-Amphidinium_carterae.1